MTLTDLASIGSLISGVAVLISLMFVGFQLRQNTMQLKRSEANSTMEQASAWRLAIVADHDLADLWVKGRSDAAALDSADEERFTLLLEESLWMVFNIWDRTNRGLLDKDHWDKVGAPFLAKLLRHTRSASWWSGYKSNVLAEFARDVDAAISAERSRS